jgi:o-succinylbenzoate synthase
VTPEVPGVADLGVAAIRVERAALAYRSPLATAHGILDRRDVVLLTVVDRDGRDGWGEAAPLPGFTPETVDDAEAAILRWADDGIEPDASPTARAAIDSALLNLAAAQLCRPVHDILAPGSSSRVPVTALIAGPTTDDLAHAARRAVADGHPGVKVKVGSESFDLDLERVASVREAIGGAGLRLDANGAWTVDEAIDHLGRLVEFDPEFVEEPTAGLDELAAVRAVSAVPVAVDESAPDLTAVERALAVGAPDVLVLKPSALGGPRPTVEATRMAKDAGVTVVVTSLLEGSIGIRAAAHLASALGLMDPAPGLATADLLDVDPGEPLIPDSGALVLD